MDSAKVQGRVQRTCTGLLPRHLGATPRDLRLSMAQAVWFTPDVEQVEAGANWFRCDVVVVAAQKKLLRLPLRTKGWGTAPAIAMCATAEPGTKAFARVTCGTRHSWVAVATVDLPGARLPGPRQVQARMDPVCRGAARARLERPALLHLVAGESDAGAVGRRPALWHLLGAGLMIVDVTPEDWAEFREIRLRALADAPDAFGTTLTGGLEQTESAWRSRLDIDDPILVVRSGGTALADGGGWRPPGAPGSMIILSHVDGPRGPWPRARRGAGGTPDRLGAQARHHGRRPARHRGQRRSPSDL